MYSNVNISKKTINTDATMANAVVFHLYLLLCKNMLVGTSEWFLSFNDIFNNSIIVCMVMVYVFLLFKSNLINQLTLATVIIILVAFSFIGITYICDYERFHNTVFPFTYVKSQFRLFIAYSLPLFAVVSCLNSLDALLNGLFKYTSIVFWVSTIAFLLSIKQNETIYNYSMSYGNAVMFLSVVLLFKFKHTLNIFTLFQFLLTVIYILISGSRGPLVCIAVALFVCLLTYKKVILKVAFVIIAFLGLLILFSFYNEIIQFVQSILEKFDLHSRTFELLLSGKIGSDSGRSQYHKELWEAIAQSPVLGLGAFGGEATVGLAHSLYLDIFANFGLVIGSLFILCVLVNDFCVIYYDRGTAAAELLTILSIIILPRGFYDDAFWSAKELWMMMGIFVHCMYCKKGEMFKYASKRCKHGNLTNKFR